MGIFGTYSTRYYHRDRPLILIPFLLWYFYAGCLKIFLAFNFNKNLTPTYPNIVSCEAVINLVEIIIPFDEIMNRRNFSL